MDPPISVVHGRRVLVVEDQMVIAIDLSDMLADAGAAEVEIARTIAEGGAVLARTLPDFALLDVQLGADPSFPLADALAARGAPFLFVTAYGDAGAIPARFADVPRLFKPFDPQSLLAALSRLAKAP